MKRERYKNQKKIVIVKDMKNNNVRKVLKKIGKFFRHEHEWLDFSDEKQTFFKQGGHPAGIERVGEDNVQVRTDKYFSFVNSGYYEFCNCGAYRRKNTGKIQYFNYDDEI